MNPNKFSSLTDYQNKLLEELIEAPEGYQLKKGDYIHVRGRNYEGFLFVQEMSEDGTLAFAKFKDGIKTFRFPSVYTHTNYQNLPHNPHSTNQYIVLVRLV